MQILLETAYFMNKLHNFNQHTQQKTISQDFISHYFFPSILHKNEKQPLKTSIYLKFLKFICEKDNSQLSCECQPICLRKKLFRTSSVIHFAFIFPELITITSSEAALKVSEQTFFPKIQVKSSVTCNLPIQFRFI